MYIKQDNEDIYGLMKRTGSILTGHHVLSSGMHSETYIECANLLKYPWYAGTVGTWLADVCQGTKPNVVIGIATGGIVLAHEVARHLGTRPISLCIAGTKLPTCVRIGTKDRVLIIDDVRTTGESILEAKGTVEMYRATVVGIGVIVDRGDPWNLNTPLFSLLKLPLASYAPEACPACLSSNSLWGEATDIPRFPW